MLKKKKIKKKQKEKRKNENSKNIQSCKFSKKLEENFHKMKLDKKKELAAKTLCVGKNRIIFEKSRLGEIKEAITRQDIRDLVAGGAIKINLMKGRRKNKRKKSRSAGNIRKKVNKRKQEYVKLTRKLRRHITELKKHGRINQDAYSVLRKRIKAKLFRDKRHLQEQIKQME